MGTLASGRPFFGLLTLVAALTLATGAEGGKMSRTTAASAKSTALPTWRNVYDWPNGDGYVGWHSDTTAPDDYGLQSALGGQHGLWLWPLGGHKTYDTRDNAQWTYTAPGTTQLESVQLSYAWTNKLLAHHCIDIGLLDDSGNVVTHDELCKPPPQSPRTLTLTDPASSPTSKVLYFRVHVDCGGASSCNKTIPSKDPLTNGAYARLLKVDMTLIDHDVPLVTPSGPLFALDGGYTDGRSAYDVTLSAHDLGSGVSRGWTVDSHDATVATQNGACDPTHHTESLDNRVCPADLEYTASVPLSAYPEGAVAFGQRAIDLAGIVGSSVDWTVFVDRTPPSAASSLAEQSFDTSSGELVVGWADGVDPPLADGSPGSGVQSTDYRYAVDGGDWSDWQTSDTSTATVDGITDGQQVQFELRSVDSVGNVGPVASGGFTVTPMTSSEAAADDVTQDPGADRALTAAEAAQVVSIARGDSRIASLLGGRHTTAGDVTPWTSPDGSVIGGTLTLSWGDPLDLATDWPQVQFHDTDSGYDTSTFRFSVTNATQLDVIVDLTKGDVVGFEPSGGAVVSDATTADSDPASVNDGLAQDQVEPAGGLVRSLTGSRVQYVTTHGAIVSTAALLPDPPAPEAPVAGDCNSNGGLDAHLLTSRNTVGIGSDHFWNWDFCERGTSSVTHRWATFNADNPVTVVFWGNVDVRTAKDLWNRGIASTRLLGVAAWGRVWDRKDPGTPVDHVAPAGPVWDSDRGAYLGRPSTPYYVPSGFPPTLQLRCTSHLKWHYRVHAPGPDTLGDDRMYNLAWHYYVLATTHQDHNELFKLKCPGYWSGNSDATENKIADVAPTHRREIRELKQVVPGRGPQVVCSYPSDPWVVEDANTGIVGVRNSLDLHNRDMRGQIGDHVYLNDGKATMIHVSQLSHPFSDCPQNP
jgi:hypothetical protein